MTTIITDINREDVSNRYINALINDLSQEQMRDALFFFMTQELDKRDNAQLEALVNFNHPDLLAE